MICSKGRFASCILCPLRVPVSSTPGPSGRCSVLMQISKQQKTVLQNWMASHGWCSQVCMYTVPRCVQGAETGVSAYTLLRSLFAAGVLRFKQPRIPNVYCSSDGASVVVFGACLRTIGPSWHAIMLAQSRAVATNFRIAASLLPCCQKR